jgi:hypothetical protein
MLAVALLLALGCASRGRVELLAGDPQATNLAALVDSEPAHRLLVDLLARRSADRRLAASVVIDQERDPIADLGRLPDQEQLRRLALDVSVDFAALSFARTLGADERAARCRRPLTAPCGTALLAAGTSCGSPAVFLISCCSRQPGSTAAIRRSGPTSRASAECSSGWRSPTG